MVVLYPAPFDEHFRLQKSIEPFSNQPIVLGDAGLAVVRSEIVVPAIERNDSLTGRLVLAILGDGAKFANGATPEKPNPIITGFPLGFQAAPPTGT